MSSSTKSIQRHLADMSFLEKIGVLPKLTYTIANAVAALLAGIFRSGKQPSSYYRNICYTAFRTFMSITTLKQQHFVSLSTDDAYYAFCKKHNLQPESETLPDGTLAHWIGPKTASKIIVNFHGGGYVLPAGPDMFKFSWQIQQFASKQGKDVAVIFLSYDLAPKAKYPRQLTQATALVSHLINNLSKKPSNIVFTGDSAGANLITQLISHISHPHPSVPKLELAEKFRGICLISPWISFDVTSPSFKRNQYTDILTIAAGTKWSSAFMTTPWPHKESSDSYNQAITAPKGWWDDIMVDEVLVVGGEDEVLIDSIKKFGEILKEAIGDRCTTINIQGEMHDQPSVDLMIGYKEPGQQAQAITNWVSAKL